VKVGLCLAEIDPGVEFFERWLEWGGDGRDKFEEANEVDAYRQKWSSSGNTFTGFAVANLVAMANEERPPRRSRGGRSSSTSSEDHQQNLSALVEVRIFIPFPVHALPEPFNELVSRSATALQVDLFHGGCSSCCFGFRRQLSEGIPSGWWSSPTGWNPRSSGL
jgi:hypothetical protein